MFGTGRMGQTWLQSQHSSLIGIHMSLSPIFTFLPIPPHKPFLPLSLLLSILPTIHVWSYWEHNGPCSRLTNPTPIDRPERIPGHRSRKVKGLPCSAAIEVTAKNRGLLGKLVSTKDTGDKGHRQQAQAQGLGCIWKV